jgi:hypothetical protein
MVVLLAGIGFVIWAEMPLGPLPEAIAALQSNERVSVDTSRWLTFMPRDGSPTTGFIFYPGGRVDPRSYAPEAQAIAAEGFLVVIVPMPLNLAVIAPNRALEVQHAFPAIQHWAVGGHSLGGAMAASFAHDHPDAVEGLVLWAAYPPNSDDLSGMPVDVLLLDGTRDGLVNPDTLAAAHTLLPANTRYLMIEGGNHAQFGSFGAQPGDNMATISRAEQQRQTVAATVQLLQQIAQR